MYAQQYTPDAEVANDLDLNALAEVAAEYEEMHPGVTIEFVDDKFDRYVDTVRTKAAAGELWDVFWAQWAALSGSLTDGVAYDLAPAFSEPNPYAEGFDTWAEAMNEQVIATTRTGEGRVAQHQRRLRPDRLVLQQGPVRAGRHHADADHLGGVRRRLPPAGRAGHRARRVRASTSAGSSGTS